MDISKEILSDLIVHMKYAKYIPSKQRRETWHELVTRNMDMHIKKFPSLEDNIRKYYSFVYDKKVLPSMRSMQFAGKPIEISPARLFNCSYLPVSELTAFSEIMFLLLSGVGVGFSVQKHHVDMLPEVIKPNPKRTRRYLVGDSIEGWSDSIKVLFKSYFGRSSSTPIFDYSDIRPKGALLVTSGGKAPGAQPLRDCINKITSLLDGKNNGDKLTSLEVHDLVCHLADAVLAGGIRRAALISLFSADDEEMLSCKSGSWWELNPQRGRANNSAVLLRHKVTKEFFMNLWARTKASNAGEPAVLFTNDKEYGVNPCCLSGSCEILTSDGYKEIGSLVGDVELINKDGQVCNGTVWSTGVKPVIKISLNSGYEIKCTKEHRFLLADGSEVEAGNLRIGNTFLPFTPYDIFCPIKVTGIDYAGEEEVFDFNLQDDTHWGVVEGVITHNCEVSLKSAQMCNLCEVNVSDVSSQQDLNERVEAASFIGTLQASYTDFHYLRDIWKKTCEKDALLGISMTGIASGNVLKYDLKEAAKVVKDVNEYWAKKIGINKSARLTVVKPAGTTSIVLGCSSGIHAWHNDYYIRRIRVGKNEAIYTYLSIYHPELIEDDFFRPQDTAVISIPQKAPEGAILRHESPLNLLERVKYVFTNWIKEGHRDGDNSHNVSATVSLREEDWGAAGEWMWENKEFYNGLSVLPYSDHTYVQAPFEDCDEETFNRMYESLKRIDLTKVVEITDNTNLQGEAACAGGACEVV